MLRGGSTNASCKMQEPTWLRKANLFLWLWLALRAAMKVFCIHLTQRETAGSNFSVKGKIEDHGKGTLRKNVQNQ